MRGIDKLRAGDFNSMLQELQDDGSTLVELVKRGEGIKYRFAVRDLYGPDEVILWEEEVPV